MRRRKATQSICIERYIQNREGGVEKGASIFVGGGEQSFGAILGLLSSVNFCSKDRNSKKKK